MKRLICFFAVPVIIIVLILITTLSKGIKLSLDILNPIQGIEYIKKSSKKEKKSTDGFNPFEGFMLPKKTQETVKTPPPPDTDYPIVEMTYAPLTNDITYKSQSCYIKNLTKLPRSEVEAELLAPIDAKVEKNSDKPQILIMHTHATESYQNYPELFYDPAYSCRTLDTSKNMISVGEIMTNKLNSLGYNTLQDKTLHDSPSYNASYGRSKATVEEYLKNYPSIKIVLDIHRDAIEKTDGTRIRPIITIDGEKYAQVMIISGADNGKMNMPNYKKNLRFASHLQNSLESLYPSFTRPVLFDYRNYNQQLTSQSLLIEVGSHGNTLQEAQNAAGLIATALAKMLDSMQ